MKFLLEDWLEEHKRTWRNKKCHANTVKALNRHDKDRTATFQAKCEKYESEIRRLNDLNLTAYEMADELGIHHTHIYRMLKELNIDYHRSRFASR